MVSFRGVLLSGQGPHSSAMPRVVALEMQILWLPWLVSSKIVPHGYPFFLFFQGFIYLFQKSNRQRERQIYLLVYSLNGSHSQHWVSQGIIQVSYMCGRGPSTQVIFWSFSGEPLWQPQGCRAREPGPA